MRFIDEFPATSPFQSQRFAQLAYRLVIFALSVVLLPVSAKNSDIECGPEVMPALPAFSFGDDLPRFGASLGIKLVLLRIRAQAADNLGIDPLCHSQLDQFSGQGLQLRMQSRNVARASL